LNTWIGLPCPNCSYEFEVQLIDARVQAYRRCPCCRELIHLRDANGSMFGALESIDNAMQSLDDTLRRMF
jgi:hypothetical protein